MKLTIDLTNPELQSQLERMLRERIDATVAATIHERIDAVLKTKTERLTDQRINQVLKDHLKVRVATLFQDGFAGPSVARQLLGSATERALREYLGGLASEKLSVAVTALREVATEATPARAPEIAQHALARIGGNTMAPQKLARLSMPDADRVKLVARVLRVAYEKTESWNAEYLGTTLAYLARAICTPGDFVQFVKAIPRDQAHLRLLREWFGPEDPVWNFIEEEEEVP